MDWISMPAFHRLCGLELETTTKWEKRGMVQFPRHRGRRIVCRTEAWVVFYYCWGNYHGAKIPITPLKPLAPATFAPVDYHSWRRRWGLEQPPDHGFKGYGTGPISHSRLARRGIGTRRVRRFHRPRTRPTPAAMAVRAFIAELKS